MDESTTGIRHLFKWLLLSMLEPPWRHSSDGESWIVWVVGWGWTVAGVVLGAFIAPPLLQRVGLSNSPYRDALDIGIAVVAGLLVQAVGWCLIVLAALVDALTGDHIEEDESGCLSVLVFGLLFALPLAGVGYGLYRYFSWVGSGQRSVTVAFVGALLIKTFLIPSIKGIVTGAIFRWFIRWLRGDKAKPKGA